MAVELLIDEPIEGESNKAIAACNDYLRLGISRSLRALLEQYSKQATDNEQTENPPTTKWSTLSGWSAKYGWVERAQAYDKSVDEQKTVIANARRKEVMQSGVALDYERVQKLARLANLLEEQIYYVAPVGFDASQEGTDEDGDEMPVDGNALPPKFDPNDPRAKHPNMWARDVKALGKGKDFRVVNIVRFNSALLTEFRATLDDIAKETGGRRQRNVIESIDYDKLSTEQLRRIGNGEDPIQVILSEFVSD